MESRQCKSEHLGPYVQCLVWELLGPPVEGQLLQYCHVDPGIPPPVIALHIHLALGKILDAAKVNENLEQASLCSESSPLSWFIVSIILALACSS